MVTNPTQGVGFFTNFNTENGLPLDGIHYSMLDKKGNLWLGTRGGGVIRYDGKSFTQYTTEQGLADNFVTKFIEDHSGNLWFGTANGFSRFDGKSFKSFIVNPDVVSKMVYSILEDKSGTIWLGTKGGGVSRFDGKSFTTISKAGELANSSVYTILEDRKGVLWFGSENGRIGQYDGKTLTTFKIRDAADSHLINCIIEDKAGNLWIGTDGDGAYRYDGSVFVNFSKESGLANNIVKCISKDRSGNLWFATADGVSQYDGKLFTNFTVKDGLASNSVTGITEDKSGNLWFSTEASGMSCYNGKSFIHFARDQGLVDNVIWCIGEDKKGHLWFGSLRGAARYDGKSFTNFSTGEGLVYHIVQCITTDKAGNLWFGTSKGISRYDGKSFTNYTSADGLINSFIRCITEDRKGNLWIGTNKGFFRFDGKSFSQFSTSDGLGENTVNSILEDTNGILWLGTNGGISRFDGQSFTNYNADQGLAGNLVSNIIEDKVGNLWIGADGGGICRFDGKTFISYTTRDGLPDNIVSQLTMDSKGNIVIGTNDGLAVITSFIPKILTQDNLAAIPASNKLNNNELGRFTPKMNVYNSATGYPVKDVNFGQNGIFLDSKGILWIGTGSDITGLVRFDPFAINQDSTAPEAFIQSVKVNNQTLSWYDLELDKSGKRDSLSLQFDSISRFYHLPYNLVLSYKSNKLTFDFGALELQHPNLVKYQYILEGYDKDWSQVSAKTTAAFGNVREGTYTFKVKAQRPNGNWGEPIAYTFEVLPPPWRTWWAYLVYSVLLILVIILIVWLYSRRLVRRNTALQNIIEEKEKFQAELIIAKEKAEESDRLKSAFLANMSHEIRTPMNGILGFTELLKEADLTGEEQQRYINTIEKTGERLLNIITNIVVFSQLEAGAVVTSIGETNINDQLDFIDSFFKPQAEQKGLKLSCTKRLRKDEALIKTDKEKIYSILTNLVKNSINFTRSGSIEFGCEKKDHIIEFFVKDTGIGISENQRDIIFNRFRKVSEEFTRTHEGAGLGLPICKGYVEILGGRIWMESIQGEGSTFYFTIKSN